MKISTLLISLIFISLALLPIPIVAQETTETKKEPESVKPTYGVIVYRKCSVVNIDGTRIYDVTLRFKAKKNFKTGVLVTVINGLGEIVYKKRFSRSHLYCFSDNAVQVGYANAIIEVIAFKDNEGFWCARICEKGIY